MSLIKMKPKFISQAAAKDIGRQAGKNGKIGKPLLNMPLISPLTATMDCLSNSLSKANYPAEYGIVVK
jgi:hypothetical protein